MPYFIDDGEKKMGRIYRTERENTVFIKFVNLEIHAKSMKRQKKNALLSLDLARQHSTV